jgi:hypothetical protein
MISIRIKKVLTQYKKLLTYTFSQKKNIFKKNQMNLMKPGKILYSNLMMIYSRFIKKFRIALLREMPT